jgi:hypothetical protein
MIRPLHVEIFIGFPTVFRFVENAATLPQS